MQMNGIAASPGIAIARAHVYQEASLEIVKVHLSDTQIDEEMQRLKAALDKAKAEIEQLHYEMKREIGNENADIFTAHFMILEDTEFIQQIVEQIQSEHWNVEYAVQYVIEQYFHVFQGLDDLYMRERASDIRDIGKRIQHKLLGIEGHALANIQEDVIVIAHDLSPSDTAQLNHHVKAYVTEIGGRTSHSAIMARSLELPAVVGVSSLIDQNLHHAWVIVDGFEGILIVHPSEDELKDYRLRMQIHQEEQSKLRKYVQLPSVTLDDHYVEIGANIGTPKDAEAASQFGPEGIGLFRTEFLYMDRTSLPSENEQFEAYKSVLLTMGKRPVIFRTLDIGGDKKLPYLDLPIEENPFLGYRAIRLCLDQPNLFITQLRAILRASAFGNVKIMYPMISGLEELQEANALLKRAKFELDEEEVAVGHFEVGMMIEVPSAALIIDLLAEEVDFFSIGTNDLIQYVTAVDRMNEKISYLYQPFHPALLRLIQAIVKSAHDKGKWVGVCGEMASDETAAALLLGLGVDELSMSAGSILRVRRLFSGLYYHELQDVSRKCLQLKTAKEIREYAESKITYHPRKE